MEGTSSTSRRRSSQTVRESQVAELLRRRSQAEANEEDALVATSVILDKAFSQQLRKNINSSYASGLSRMEADLNSSPVFTKTWTPLAFEMMNHSAFFLFFFSANDIQELIELTGCRSEGDLAVVLAGHFIGGVQPDGDGYVSLPLSSWSHNQRGMLTDLRLVADVSCISYLVPCEHTLGSCAFRFSSFVHLVDRNRRSAGTQDNRYPTDK